MKFLAPLFFGAIMTTSLIAYAQSDIKPPFETMENFLKEANAIEVSGVLAPIFNMQKSGDYVLVSDTKKKVRVIIAYSKNFKNGQPNAERWLPSVRWSKNATESESFSCSPNEIKRLISLVDSSIKKHPSDQLKLLHKQLSEAQLRQRKTPAVSAFVEKNNIPELQEYRKRFNIPVAGKGCKIAIWRPLPPGMFEWDTTEEGKPSRVYTQNLSDWKQFLKEMGVSFPPDGFALFFQEAKILVVSTTDEGLDTVGILLEK